MLIVTSQEMARLDADASHRYKIPGLTLMETAGKAVADWILEEYRHHFQTQSIVYICCGPGNNGGDGLVCARYLASKGKTVVVMMVGQARQLTGDALENYRRLKGTSVSCHDISSDIKWQAHIPKLKKNDLIVDAVLGTGLRRPPEGMIETVIRWMNRSKVPVVSVDIPSGLSADTGRPLGIAVKADSTVTFQLRKQGHVLYPGCEYSGVLKVVDIGIPPLLIKQHQLKRHLVLQEMVSPLMKPRPKDTHKGQQGHALVVGGELGKIGAGLMSAKAFMRAGGGLASFALPESSYERIDPHFLELMYLPLHTQAAYLTEAAAEPLLKYIDGKAVCIMGPGMGCNARTEAFMERFLPKVHVPIVLDADGINCVARNLDLLSHHRGRIVLTPHPGEMSRLTGLKTSYIQNDRVAVAKDFAEMYGVYVVLKGYRTIIATPQGEIFINTSGNPGMATAGMGDVLSGVIASFIAQGYSLKHALLIAVFVHGMAGDDVCREKGERGILAQDVIEQLPYAIANLSKE